MGALLSVEVVTESSEQAADLAAEYAGTPLQVEGVVVPASYRASRGTQLKARALHYAVELRRTGYNRKPGKTFIVHFDEESVMVPRELRKLLRYLATTPADISEGPIYYPLDFRDAHLMCRAMEASRPVCCFECRALLEQGMPLHLHGSNLVVEEELENELGWDIGTLDGHAFVAEDHAFAMRALISKGPRVFGWHGAVMLEQPPFTVRSALRQRYRWIFGVLQGLSALPGSRRRTADGGKRVVGLLGLSAERDSGGRSRAVILVRLAGTSKGR